MSTPSNHDQATTIAPTTTTPAGRPPRAHEVGALDLTHHDEVHAEVELIIGGMACASCAARIEKKLNKLDGVAATVNYATEKAKVRFADNVSVGDLIATVTSTGYTAKLPSPPTPTAGPAAAPGIPGTS
ncbi:hypothetical protein GCM10009740_15930 [Terrabacter terrae]|uniref:HMA domain-containing protein n=1 Tax=Terrabacter terrae TaxID=318434 RepID=A0ABP5FLB9_9MICO